MAAPLSLQPQRREVPLEREPVPSAESAPTVAPEEFLHVLSQGDSERFESLLRTVAPRLADRRQSKRAYHAPTCVTCKRPRKGHPKSGCPFAAPPGLPPESFATSGIATLSPLTESVGPAVVPPSTSD